MSLNLTRRQFAAIPLCVAAAPRAAFGQSLDRVRVGVFPVSSSLPLFVGIDKGFFAEEKIEIVQTRLIGGPPNVAALIQNQIDASSVLVTIEGMNANLKKPGVAMYISLNSQNRKYPMEQFVVRKGFEAKSLTDLKGKKIMSAPGPANVSMARAALAAVGLNEGDYQLDQLDMGQHINAMTAGTFDAAFTLEPNASTMRNMGVAQTLETGIIAKYVLGDPDANAWVGGCALSSDFIKDKPDVARRYARAWGKAINFIVDDTKGARAIMAKNTLTPPDVAETVPMLRFAMVSDLSDKDIADLQRFIDFSVKNKILAAPVDVSKFVQRF